MNIQILKGEADTKYNSMPYNTCISQIKQQQQNISPEDYAVNPMSFSLSLSYPVIKAP